MRREIRLRVAEKAVVAAEQLDQQLDQRAAPRATPLSHPAVSRKERDIPEWMREETEPAARSSKVLVPNCHLLVPKVPRGRAGSLCAAAKREDRGIPSTESEPGRDRNGRSPPGTSRSCAL